MPNIFWKHWFSGFVSKNEVGLSACVGASHFIINENCNIFFIYTFLVSNINIVFTFKSFYVGLGEEALIGIF